MLWTENVTVNVSSGTDQPNESDNASSMLRDENVTNGRQIRPQKTFWQSNAPESLTLKNFCKDLADSEERTGRSISYDAALQVWRIIGAVFASITSAALCCMSCVGCVCPNMLKEHRESEGSFQNYHF